jgi:hypothetical protein
VLTRLKISLTKTYTNIRVYHAQSACPVSSCLIFRIKYTVRASRQAMKTPSLFLPHCFIPPFYMRTHCCGGRIKCAMSVRLYASNNSRTTERIFIRRWLSSGLLLRVVWYNFNEVSGCLLPPSSGRRVLALMMEAVSTSETSVKLYQTTRHNNWEDIHRCENLKSRIFIKFYIGEFY